MKFSVIRNDAGRWLRVEKNSSAAYVRPEDISSINEGAGGYVLLEAHHGIVAAIPDTTVEEVMEQLCAALRGS